MSTDFTGEGNGDGEGVSVSAYFGGTATLLEPDVERQNFER